MTYRERFARCALCQPIDRSPFFFHFGPWQETLAAWKEEGVTSPTAWLDGFGFDAPHVCLANVVNHYFYPAFEPKVLRREGEYTISLNGKGEIIQEKEGVSTIPKILKSPVSNREDWLRLKAERLNPDDPGRFPENWKELAARFNAQDVPVQLGCYPCGLYGTLRDLMGVEESLLAFYDTPELVHEIMDGLTDFWLALYERICKDVKVECIHIWEDMSGKQGSLISPAFVEEFMLPNYRRFRAFADAHGIPVIEVDTDGDCEQLIPLFAQAGVNLMLPFEVQAGSDVIALRKKYPQMAMMGGIDKLEIMKGGAAMEKELERIRPLINQTGYFPALDHLIPPQMTYAVYSEFVSRIREMIFRPELP